MSNKLVTDQNNYISNQLNNSLPYIILGGLIIFYILFGYGVLISNDSVTNIDQITALDLWSRSSHFSFHLFGIIFYLVFSKVFGLAATTSIEIMLAVFSATAGVALYKIVLKKYNNINQAVFTVVIYSLSSGIFRFSCQVEYLILVPSLGIISLYFYSKGYSLVSGFFLGLGLLTSPFIVLFTPMFFLFTTFKEVFKKKNIVFAISVIVVYITVNLLTYQETVSGHWSYGGEVNYFKEAFGEINILRQAAIYLYGYLRSFNIILILVPFTLYRIYSKNKNIFYVFIITILIHLPAAIPEARYGGYQMTAYPIMAICTGYFINGLFKNRKLISMLIIVLYVLINFFVVFTERDFCRDLKDTYVNLSKNLRDNSVLIVYQATKPIKNVYAPGLQVHDLLSDYQNELAKNIPGYVPTNLPEILDNNDTIYLLESGTGMPDDYLKLLVANFTQNQGAKVKGFALAQILELKPTIHYKKLKGYSLDVYELTK